MVIDCGLELVGGDVCVVCEVFDDFIETWVTVEWACGIVEVRVILL